MVNKTKENKESKKPKNIQNIADLPGILQYAHHAGSFQVTPTKEGVIKGHALNAMKEQSDHQLSMIYEQMTVLAKQAQSIKDRVEVSLDIYEAKLNFSPDIGHTYYLYEKFDGKKTISLIGPDEWTGKPKFKNFLAKVKLLSDHTWEILQKKS